MNVFGFNFGKELEGCDIREPEKAGIKNPILNRNQQREFSAGVVADLHDENCGEQAAAKLGIDYVPGVGPVLMSVEQAQAYCRETNQAPKNAVHITRRQCRRNAFGHESKRTRKQVEVDLDDRSAFLGGQRRDEREIKADAARHKKMVEAEAKARALVEENRKRKTYYSFQKP